MQLIASEAWPGVYRMIGRFDRAMNESYKQARGRYVAAERAWYVPRSGLCAVAQDAERNGYEFLRADLRPMPLPPLPADLLPHQVEAITLALTNRVVLCQWDTGTGKTRTALEIARTAGKHTLIVAPRAVVPVWLEQAARWGYPAPVEIRSGRKVPSEQPHTLLTSYGSVGRIPEQWRFDCLVLDELHYAIHAKSMRSRALLSIMLANRQAVRVGLTATPVSASMTDLHNQLHVLCPHRWGTWYQWVARYHQHDHDGYEGALRVGPVRQDLLADMLAEIGDVIHVAGHADVAHALPNITWEIVSRNVGTRTTMPPSLTSWRAEQTVLSSERSAHAVAVAKDLHQLGKSVAVVTYLRETADSIGTALGWPVVDGSMPAHKRAKLLSKAEPVVLTMMSCTEGLDLRAYTDPLIVEAYPVPRYMEQIIGRFCRLYATAPVTVRWLQLTGTSDDIIAARLVDRLQEQAAIMRGNKLRTGLAALLSHDYSSDAWLQELNAQLGTAIETEDAMAGWATDDDGADDHDTGEWA